MNLEVNEKEGKYICMLEGIMNVHTSEAAEDEIMRNINSCKNVCDIEINLKKVDYVTSFFIRVCVSIKNHNKVVGFTITNVQGEVFKIFEILGLVKKLNVCK